MSRRERGRQVAVIGRQVAGIGGKVVVIVRPVAVTGRPASVLMGPPRSDTCFPVKRVVKIHTCIHT